MAKASEQKTESVRARVTKRLRERFEACLQYEGLTESEFLVSEVRRFVDEVERKQKGLAPYVTWPPYPGTTFPTVPGAPYPGINPLTPYISKPGDVPPGYKMPGADFPNISTSGTVGDPTAFLPKTVSSGTISSVKPEDVKVWNQVVLNSMMLGDERQIMFRNSFALLTRRRIPKNGRAKELYYYELQHDGINRSVPVRLVEGRVGTDFYATLVTTKKIDMFMDGGDLLLNGEESRQLAMFKPESVS